MRIPSKIFSSRLAVFLGLERSLMPNTAILLSNIGTTALPTPKAVSQYLKEFLSDKRVIELPKWFWQPLLRCVILPTRSKKSAKLYEKIWQPEGSPLLIF